LRSDYRVPKSAFRLKQGHQRSLITSGGSATPVRPLVQASPSRGIVCAVPRRLDIRFGEARSSFRVCTSELQRRSSSARVSTRPFLYIYMVPFYEPAGLRGWCFYGPLRTFLLWNLLSATPRYGLMRYGPLTMRPMPAPNGTVPLQHMTLQGMPLGRDMEASFVWFLPISSPYFFEMSPNNLTIATLSNVAKRSSALHVALLNTLLCSDRLASLRGALFALGLH